MLNTENTGMKLVELQDNLQIMDILVNRKPSVCERISFWPLVSHYFEAILYWLTYSHWIYWKSLNKMQHLQFLLLIKLWSNGFLLFFLNTETSQVDEPQRWQKWGFYSKCLDVYLLWGVSWRQWTVFSDSI